MTLKLNQYPQEALQKWWYGVDTTPVVTTKIKHKKPHFYLQTFFPVMVFISHTF